MAKPWERQRAASQPPAANTIPPRRRARSIRSDVLARGAAQPPVRQAPGTFRYFGEMPPMLEEDVLPGATKFDKDAAKDIGKGIATAPIWLTNAAGDTVESLANMPGDFISEQPLFKALAPDFKRKRVDIPEASIPEDMQSVTGQLGRGMAPWLVTRRAIGKTAKGGNFLQQLGKDVAATFAAYEGDEGRVSDMLPIEQNPLKSRADDTPLEGRLKNVGEDLAFAGPAGVPFLAYRGGKAFLDAVGSRPVGSATASVSASAQPGATRAGKQANALNATQTPPPTAPANALQVAKSDARNIYRMMKTAGVPANDIKPLIAGMTQAYNGLNDQRMRLALFASEYLPQHLPKPLADAVNEQFRAFGFQQMTSGGPGAGVMRESIDTLRNSQRDFLESEFDAGLGKKDLFTTKGTVKKLKAENAEAIYKSQIDRQQRNLAANKATNEQVAARDDLLNILRRDDFFAKIPDEIKFEARNEGRDLWEHVHQRPLEAAHWLQSKLGFLERKGGDNAGLYKQMRRMLLEPLEEAVPGYRGARMQHGDAVGQSLAVEFGDRFFTVAKNKLATAELREAYKALPKSQQEIARRSVKEKLTNEFRNAKASSAVDPVSGEPLDQQQVFITQLQKDGVLDALETIFAAGGKRSTAAIRKVMRENEGLPSFRSDTAPNQAKQRNAIEAVRSPFNRVAQGVADKTGYSFTIPADMATMAFGGPPLFTAYKVGGDLATHLSRPNSKKLASTAALLYNTPPPAQAPASRIPREPPGTRRAGPPKIEATPEALEDLQRQYDTIDPGKNPREAERIRKQIIQVQKELDRTPPLPSPRTGGGEGGFVDPRLLTHPVSTGAMGAGVGYAVAPEDQKFEGAALGASIGGLGNVLARRGRFAARSGDAPALPDTSVKEDLTLNIRQMPSGAWRAEFPKDPRTFWTFDSADEALEHARRFEKNLSPEDRARLRPTYTPDGRHEIVRHGGKNYLVPRSEGKSGDPPVSMGWGSGRRPPVNEGLRGNAPANSGSVDAQASSARQQGTGPNNSPDEALQGGTPEALARAREQGFDVETPLYHGSGRDIGEFSGTVWVSEDPRLASQYANMRQATGDPNPNVLPLYKKAGIVEFDADRLPETVTLSSFFDEATRQARASGRSFDEAATKQKIARLRELARIEESGPHYSRYDIWYQPSSMFGKEGERLAASLWRDLGFDGVRMTEQGAVTHGVFDPKNIRGKFASFDPSKSDSPNLLAGLPNGTPEMAVGGGGAIYGWHNPSDVNDDGVIDGTDRMGSAGLNFIGGVTSTAAARAMLRGRGGAETHLKRANVPDQMTFGGGRGKKPLTPAVEEAQSNSAKGLPPIGRWLRGPPLEKGAREKLQRALPIISVEARERISANAAKPPGERVSAMEASGDDPTMLAAIGSFTKGPRPTNGPPSLPGRRGPPKLDELDEGIEETFDRARNMPPRRPIGALAKAQAEAAKELRNAKSAATRAANKGELTDAHIERRKAAEAGAQIAKQRLAEAKIDTLGRTDAEKIVADKLSSFEAALNNRPDDSLPRALTEKLDAIRKAEGDKVFKSTLRDRKTLARLWFDAEYADRMDDLLSGRIKPRPHTLDHAVLSLAAGAGVATVGAGLVAKDIEEGAEAQREARGLPPRQKQPEPPRPDFVWDWEKQSRNEDAVEGLQQELQDLGYGISVDGQFYRSDGKPSRTAQALEHALWTLNNTREPGEPFTEEDWYALSAAAQQARRRKSASGGGRR